jgi:hypothetical protein
MAKKTKTLPKKSAKKTLAADLAARISDFLKELPKRTSKKKYQKKIKKASKSLVSVISFKPAKAEPKANLKKEKKPISIPRVEVVAQ